MKEIPKVLEEGTSIDITATKLKLNDRNMLYCLTKTIQGITGKAKESDIYAAAASLGLGGDAGNPNP